MVAIKTGPWSRSLIIHIDILGYEAEGYLSVKGVHDIEGYMLCMRCFVYFLEDKRPGKVNFNQNIEPLPEVVFHWFYYCSVARTVLNLPQSCSAVTIVHVSKVYKAWAFVHPFRIPWRECWVQANEILKAYLQRDNYWLSAFGLLMNVTYVQCHYHGNGVSRKLWVLVRILITYKCLIHALCLQ